ncbi:MAG: putative aminohydrolase SsnA [Lachnospiraceae bacterium]|nr:putative aminohydrolase SsnA [Lachnospiraceae bacterium]
MLIIGNGRVITRDDDNPFIENGAVAIDGKLIKKIGSCADIRKEFPDADYIDAKGGVIMPGMINAHNHIYSAFSRGLAIKGYDPHGFLDILDGLWWTLDRHLTLDATRMSAAATFIDSIKCGCTSMFDHHASFAEIPGSLFAIADEAKKYGIRANLCYEISDRDGKEKCDQAIKENVDFINYCKKDDTDMIAGMMGMHAQFTLSDETLHKCMEAKPEGVGCHIHVAEGIEDLHDCLKKHHKRIVNRLFDFGILGEKTILGHCIYVDPREMDLIKETDTMVVHNPESNMGNAVGCPPTLAIMHKGILTGLGTDGYTNDMFESMKVANVLHKHNLCSGSVAWAEVPQMLFYNNAAMANRYFKTPLGKLKEGYAADVITLDYKPLTPMDGNNCNGHILFGISGHCVTSTVVDGKVLMKDRELIGIDEEAVMAKCRETANKVWTAINSR